MEQTIDRQSSVVVSTSTDHVNWDITWTHAGTGSYVLESIALRFTMGTASGYSVKATEQISQGNWTQRMSAAASANNGETVTLPLSAGTWENKTSGTLRALFYKRGTNQARYETVQFVLTYRDTASASTVTVVRAMAGDPQTVLISNTDPDVWHTVRWVYADGDVDSGEITYGAATRSPAWAVPAAAVEDLYLANTHTALETGTVTVKTYTAGGNLVGTTTADAVLDLPETAAVKPAFLTRTMTETLDQTAEAIRLATGNSYVQGHTTVSLTYPGQGQLGADIASVQVITADGVQTVQSGTAAVFLVQTAGSWAVRVILTDTRGFTSELTETLFTAMAYTDPTITSLQAVRSDEHGNEQSDGSYAWVEAVATVTGQSATYTAVIREAGGSQTGSTATLPGGTGVIGGQLSEDKSYVITVTVEDGYGIRGTASIELGTGTITISRMAGGRGIAFGKIAEKYGLEVSPDWPMYVHGKEIERLIVDLVYPPGTMLVNIDPAFDPNKQWPWTRWGQWTDPTEWIRGV